MARTPDEILRQIKGLKNWKNIIPEYSFFNDNNWEAIDAQIDILEGTKSLSDFEVDGEDEYYNEAYEAEQWLDGTRDEDLFEIEE